MAKCVDSEEKELELLLWVEEDTRDAISSSSPIGSDEPLLTGSGHDCRLIVTICVRWRQIWS